MTDVNKQTNRIPQESLGADEKITTWTLPKMGGGHSKVVKSAKREAKEKPQRGRESIENVPPAAKPKPLTADELKKIADQAQQEGYADGFKEGMEKGLKQGEAKGLQVGEQKAYNETRARLEDEQRRLAAIAAQLFEPMQQQDSAIEKMLVDMVLQLASHLLVDTIEQQPAKIQQVIQEALNALPVGAKNIRVFVNKEDAKLLETVLPARHRDWQLIDDDSLARGGCRIETTESLIDFSIETRIRDYLAEIEERRDTGSDTPFGEV